jgi:hypothetical protein
MGRVMNPRLLTPAIVLVSFGAAFGLTGWNAGLWYAAAADERANVASGPSPTPLAAAVTPPPPATVAEQAMEPAPAVSSSSEVSPQPVVAQDATPAPEDELPAVVKPETQAQESEGFLDARDRAAERGARSH